MAKEYPYVEREEFISLLGEPIPLIKIHLTSDTYLRLEPANDEDIEFGICYRDEVYLEKKDFAVLISALREAKGWLK